MRTFVCVIPDAQSISEIMEFMERISEFRGYQRVSADQIHITLKFLGETSVEQAQRLDSNLSRVGAVRPFRIKISSAGVFPDLSRPKSLWLGMGDGAEPLEKLAQSVNRAARKSGFEPERRRFRAHLTVARSRDDAEMPKEMADILSKAPTPSWTCDSFVLMRSSLTPHGPVYTPLGKYLLK
jgi:2'-5' RNA ligase